MRLAIGVIVAAVFLVPGGAEAARPDFTGTWRIVVDRSTGVTPDRLDTWIVTQDANTLTLVDANFPADHRVYKLDGTPTAISNAIGEWVYRATWAGDQLTIRAEGENPAAASTEIWFIDEQGRLVIEWHRRSATTGKLLIHINRYDKIR